MCTMTSPKFDSTTECADLPISAQDVTVRYADDEPEHNRRTGGSNVMLALLLAGAAFTYFMYVKTGPQIANAAIAPEATSSNVTVASFVTAAPANVKVMERLLKNTQKTVQQFMAYPSVKQIPLSDLKTNPFRPAHADQADASAARTRTDQQRQTALRAVQNLQLQSVLVNDKNRSCMINNGLYLEGQQVDQFTVESIAAGSVVVRTGVYRFELKMQR